MKKILGLDLGVSSIGWALVNEAETKYEHSSITKLGVRIINYDNFGNSETGKDSKDPINDFRSGKGLSCNAKRTLKRSMRRNLQRYKLRRAALIDTLMSYGWINEGSILAESGKDTTFQTLKLRAKAAEKEISLEELARVFLNINKKRGYKSSRKLNKSDNTDEGSLIDGMETARILSEESITPGEYSYRFLCEGKEEKNLPEFYKSDLENEFERIWAFQKQFYPDILTDILKENLKDRNEKQTWAICEKPFNIAGTKRTTKGKELVIENYLWRSQALKEQLNLEQLAVVLQKVNAQLRNSDSYLGRISDRSKELYFKHRTVGQYQLAQLMKDPHSSLKNQVFYRQDYIEEFDRIWEIQSRFHPEMTSDKKRNIRDIIIFYQRPLKSQKSLVSYCEFEKGRKVCPKSSPVFQDFKIWQMLNNLKVDGEYLDLKSKQLLFKELSIRKELSKTNTLKLLFGKSKGHDMNFRKLEGNRTQAALFLAYSKILSLSGHDEVDFSKSIDEIMDKTASVFSALGINTDILAFDSSKSGKEMENEPLYRLWHLMYSYTEDNSKTGYDSLVSKLQEEFGFTPEYGKILASVTFEDDYGSLSTKAMCRILPYMKEGMEYSAACTEAGYRHSQRSLTKDEIENKEYRDRLDILPKNSLRNPVVEKILNQMINVINGVIDTYGKPDEIRIELARELKKNAAERQGMTEAINRSAKENKEIEEKLKQDFGMSHVSRTSIIRYKLYMELKDNGFKTLYSNTYIPYEDLFSKRFDIEHIIPQSRLFDDSFANKTLESKDINITKGDMTALDFVTDKYGQEGVERYKSSVDMLLDKGAISKTKYHNLLRTQNDIPENFIQRDLRDTQYISRKALEILGDIVKSVVATSGEITARLREDWGLVDVMKELNWDKYDKSGMTEYYNDPDGRTISRIKDWTKRNDHRHHAMDALTVAFTKRSIIQYLNTLNAKDKELQQEITSKGRLLPPMPFDELRCEARKHLDDILVSIKAKNKVATRNTNKTKRKGGFNEKVQLTPRGQLHNETVYGRILQYDCKEEKVGSSFDADKIATVACERFRDALYQRLAQYGGNPKKAFSGSNSLDKNPLFTDILHSEEIPQKVKTVSLIPVYTIRKQIDPTLKIEKVIDRHIRQILSNRLEEFGNDPKKAFSNLDENPIWLNKDKGIQIKRVTISGPTNVYALHDKRNIFGAPIVNCDGATIPCDFVKKDNNHHVAIFVDQNGNLHEQLVSFMEAVARVSLGDPVIDKTFKAKDGWKFLFSMKQNEYFIFPNKETGFDPNSIDLLNPVNYPVISKNLFRVQKLTSKDYFFRHHLETSIVDNNNLKDITWKRIRNTNNLKGIVKVRIDHLGNIVQTGEY